MRNIFCVPVLYMYLSGVYIRVCLYVCVSAFVCLYVCLYVCVCVTGQGCSALNGLKLHDSCSLSSRVTSRGIVQLAGACAGLTCLDIAFTNVSDRAIAALGVLTQLTTLRLHKCSRTTGEDFSYIHM